MWRNNCLRKYLVGSGLYIEHGLVFSHFNTRLQNMTEVEEILAIGRFS
jgi:hypothetical protein